METAPASFPSASQNRELLKDSRVVGNTNPANFCRFRITNYSPNRYRVSARLVIKNDAAECIYKVSVNGCYIRTVERGHIVRPFRYRGWRPVVRIRPY